MSDLIERLRRLYVQTGMNYVQEAGDEIERLRQLLCKCNMRTRMVGDGCEFCNPQLAEELEKERR